MRPRNIRLPLLLAIAVVCSSCKEIRIPASDNTPPSAGCLVSVAAHNVNLGPVDSDVTRIVQPDADLGVVGVGTDADGGVKSVCIVPSAQATCTNGRYNQMTHFSLAPVCSADAKRPGEQGTTERMITHALHVSAFVGACQRGFWLSQVDGSLSVAAQNYHGGSSHTATFHFKVEGPIPGISIIRPVADERLVADETVTFKADLYGPGTYAGEGLKWSSDRDGDLGQGTEVVVRNLSAGQHEIQVAGHSQRRRVSVRVFSDLGELFRATPSAAEVERVKREFTVIYVDGEKADEKWSAYERNGFDQTSAAPAPIIAISGLDVLRHQTFSEPLPFGAGTSVYDYVRSYVNTIRLRLDCGDNRGGGGALDLNRGFSVWYVPGTPTEATPDACKSTLDPVTLKPYSPMIVVHECRHCDPSDPSHTTCDGKENMDPEVENGSGHAWAMLYLMWVHRYGVSDTLVAKEDAKAKARDLLCTRFCGARTHSNPKVQAIIDELRRPVPGGSGC